jgi:hypothetical protein
MNIQGTLVGQIKPTSQTGQQLLRLALIVVVSNLFPWLLKTVFLNIFLMMKFEKCPLSRMQTG